MSEIDTIYLVRHLSLRQLQIFSAVARCGGYRLAAEELHVSQPSISGHVKKLCDTVGLPLLERVGNDMRLTPAGQKVLIAADEILQRLGRLHHDIVDLKSEVRGRLSIGVVSTAKYFMPQLLGDFLHSHPGVEPYLDVTNRAKVLERLADHKYDLVIMGQVTGILKDQVKVEKFLENKLVVVASPRHELAGRRAIPLARVAKERFLLREPGSGTRLAVDKAFSAVSPALEPYMELGSIEAIKQGVISGIGLSVLSMHSLRMELAGRYLTVLDVDGFPLQRGWHAVHLHGKQLPLVARTFLKFLREESGRVLKENEQALAKALHLPPAGQR
jgi:DNA-binding transcriptional LysR family regulator